VPLALRLSGQLLLGVVRIYARKLDFLHRDSSDALVKIRQARRRAPAPPTRSPPTPPAQAFHSGSAVELPADAQTAPLAAITQPEEELDLDSLAFFGDATASYMQLECAPGTRARARRRRAPPAGGWPAGLTQLAKALAHRLSSRPPPALCGHCCACPPHSSLRHSRCRPPLAASA